jgi:Tc5 transposase DNA-binding domain
MEESDGHAAQQVLTSKQERMLVEWIFQQERLGHEHQRVREFASEIRRFSGENPHLGKNWIGRFMQRHPEIKSKLGRKIDVQLVDNTQPWFTQFKQLQAFHKVTDDNVWNMDESSLCLAGATARES